MAETLRASLSAGQLLGAALKRYDLEWRSCMGGYSGSNEMVESSDGEWLRYDDAITLERKCQELERERDELAEKLATVQTDAFDAREDERGELTRLRAVEERAMIVIEQSIIGRDPRGNTYYMVMPHDMGNLAEACGRKG